MSAALTKYCSLGGYEQRHLFLMFLESGKFKANVTTYVYVEELLWLNCLILFSRDRRRGGSSLDFIYEST